LEEDRMKKSAHEMLASPEFRKLVSKRWTISIVLTILLFLIYYGYILLIAYDKSYMAEKIGEVTTRGIPFGIGVIVLSWILTAVYVLWANSVYDAEVGRLKDNIRH
jgi:uncharacterized membrane protein (DUF485 family)